jgi:hypothetical protein
VTREVAVVVMPHDVRTSSVRAAFGSSSRRKNAVLHTGAKFRQVLLAASLQHLAVLFFRKESGLTKY